MLRMKIFTEAHCIPEIIPKIRLEKKKTRPLSIKRKKKVHGQLGEMCCTDQSSSWRKWLLQDLRAHREVKRSITVRQHNISVVWNVKSLSIFHIWIQQAKCPQGFCAFFAVIFNSMFPSQGKVGYMVDHSMSFCRQKREHGPSLKINWERLGMVYVHKIEETDAGKVTIYI